MCAAAPSPLLRLITGLVCLAALPGSSSGAALSWNNASGGPASTAGNWSPAQVPTGSDDLTFNLLATYGVTFSATVPSSASQTYKRGTVTLTMTSPHTSGSGGIRVGDVNGDNATLTLTSGTLNSTAAALVANASGSTGTINVNDDDAALVCGSTGSGTDLTVGNSGAGTLSVTGGGRIYIADQFIAGNSSTGTANITISGFVSQFPFPVSRLEVEGTSQSRFGQSGDATVNITNGGRAQFGGDLVIANGAASNSTVTVQGAGLVLGATLDVASDLLVGRNTTPITPAGSATLNVNASGRVLVGDILFVAGDPDGGTATLHLDTGGLISTRSLTIGNGATLDLDGGNLDIDGGTLTWSATSGAPRFNGGSSNPVITMKNNATATLTPTSAGPALVVGGGPGANFCDFDVRSGADLATAPSGAASGSLVIGEGADDDGSVIVNGTGSTLTMPAGSTLVVGESGTGRFEAESGAVVSGSALAIAANAAANGLALFENPGTQATFNSVYVGGGVGGPGGNGDLLVNAQALLHVTSPGSILIYPSGFAEVAQSAVIDAPAVNPFIQGELELENGAEVNANLTIVASGGILRGPNGIPGAATINSDVRVESGGVLELTNGDLTVGRSSSSNGFDAQDGSLVAVGAHTLTVRDQNLALFDDVTINGGQIIAPNGLEIVVPVQNGRLDGTGIITTRVLFMESGASVITATGTSGITINGKFRNNSGNIDGTRYTFNANPDISDSGWTGAGAINAKVTFNNGTKVIALANMTMGDGSTNGVTFNSGTEMHLLTSNVTLADSNGVNLPNLTDMNGGDLTCSNGLLVNTGRELRGKGFIDVINSALNVFGTIEPANDDNANGTYGGLGTFNVGGAYTQGAGGHYICEIAGFDNEFRAQVDFINVSGLATLNGTLHLSLINGYVPQLGHIFNIMRYGSRSGTFAAIDAPCLRPLGLKLSVVYTATHVQVHVVADSTLGDMNCDCAVNVLDINAFVLALSDPAAYAAMFPSCNIMFGDINGDGFVNVLDINAFVALLAGN